MRILNRALTIGVLVGGVSLLGLVNVNEPAPAQADDPMVQVITTPEIPEPTAHPTFIPEPVETPTPEMPIPAPVVAPEPVTGPAPVPPTVETPGPVQEDDPAFDCRWDGNETCGVVIHGMTYLIHFQDGSPVSVNVAPGVN